MATERTKRWATWAAALGCALATATSHGEARADTDEAAVAAAREAFTAGAKLVEEARWPEALAKFQLAQEKRPHPITRYNIAACLRALGAYTAARRSYAETLQESAAAEPTEALDARTVAEVRGLLAQLDGIIATLDVTVAPLPVTVSVDGAPLSLDGPSGAVAGVRDPGPAERAPSSHFAIRLNPGVHTVTFHGDDAADAAMTYTLAPGATQVVTVHLDRLPSTLRIASVPPESVVRVDGVDVGTAPATLTRPPGVHRVHIVHPGFLPYDTQITTKPGEDLRITGKLAPESVSVTRKWWFWTSIGAALAGVAVGSYLVVRSTETPGRTPYDGGTLGWTVPAR